MKRAQSQPSRSFWKKRGGSFKVDAAFRTRSLTRRVYFQLPSLPGICLKFHLKKGFHHFLKNNFKKGVSAADPRPAYFAVYVETEGPGGAVTGPGCHGPRGPRPGSRPAHRPCPGPPTFLTGSTGAGFGAVVGGGLRLPVGPCESLAKAKASDPCYAQSFTLTLQLPLCKGH